MFLVECDQLPRLRGDRHMGVSTAAPLGREPFGGHARKPARMRDERLDGTGVTCSARAPLREYVALVDDSMPLHRQARRCRLRHPPIDCSSAHMTRVPQPLERIDEQGRCGVIREYVVLESETTTRSEDSCGLAEECRVVPEVVSGAPTHDEVECAVVKRHRTVVADDECSLAPIVDRQLESTNSLFGLNPAQ